MQGVVLALQSEHLLHQLLHPAIGNTRACGNLISETFLRFKIGFCQPGVHLALHLGDERRVLFLDRAQRFGQLGGIVGGRGFGQSCQLGL